MSPPTNGNGLKPARAVREKTWNGATLRNARFEDYDQIARLERRFGLAVKPYPEWIHLWQGNPVYRSLGQDCPLGWVLEDAGGQIVGSMGNIPFLYELEGRKLLAASGHNWVAEIAHRSASLMLLDSLINQPGVDLYLNTTVSDRAIGAVTALGCTRVPVGVWDEVAYWVTDYVGCFWHLLKVKNPFTVPLREGAKTHLRAMLARFSRAGRHLPSSATFMKSRNSVRPPVRENDIDVRECADFDEQFDIFWGEMKTRNPRLLLALRTREILAWHFRFALVDKRLWIAAAVDGGRMVAYAIFMKIANRNSGLRQAKLVDYQSLDNSSSILWPLIAWALRRCRSEGVQMLEATGRWLEAGEFFDAAPYHRQLPAWQYFYRANNPALRKLLNEKQPWAPSLFDSDAAL